MIRNKYFSGKRGFAFVEALIASFIMATCLLVVISAIYSQATVLNKNREQTIAALSAQGELESIRGMSFDNILNLGPSSSFDESEAPGLIYLHYGSDYGRGDITVDGAGFTGDPNIMRVSVTVTWNSINGQTLQNTQATLVARGGIDKQ